MTPEERASTVSEKEKAASSEADPATDPDRYQAYAGLRLIAVSFE